MELPASFVSYTRSLLGEEEYRLLEEALEADQPVSLRMNEQKLSARQDTPYSLSSTLRNSLKKVPWSASGYYLDKRLTFTFDPLFHAGCYYVQEAGSMFVEQVLKQYAGNDPVVMLDLCAASGR